jgi:hypothetical protein
MAPPTESPVFGDKIERRGRAEVNRERRAAVEMERPDRIGDAISSYFGGLLDVELHQAPAVAQEFGLDGKVPLEGASERRVKVGHDGTDDNMGGLGPVRKQRPYEEPKFVGCALAV